MNNTGNIEFRKKLENGWTLSISYLCLFYEFFTYLYITKDCLVPVQELKLHWRAVPQNGQIYIWKGGSQYKVTIPCSGTFIHTCVSHKLRLTLTMWRIDMRHIFRLSVHMKRQTFDGSSQMACSEENIEVLLMINTSLEL